jgi:hypothetical protein
MHRPRHIGARFPSLPLSLRLLNADAFVLLPVSEQRRAINVSLRALPGLVLRRAARNTDVVIREPASSKYVLKWTAVGDVTLRLLEGYREYMLSHLVRRLPHRSLSGCEHGRCLLIPDIDQYRGGNKVRVSVFVFLRMLV